MEIEIDFTKSAQENADAYFKKAKKLLIKNEGAKRAIEELKKQLNDAKEKKKKEEDIKKIKIKTIVKKEWYENFHWFFTSNNLLAIGGRDASQNELINSKYFNENDLFFHANIFGASLVVLKNGIDAIKNIKEEVAQFAGSYSSAWKEGLSTIDVYSVKRDQVSKSTNKGSLGKGSFLISGEREWYNVPLELVFFVKDNRLNVTPKYTFDKLLIKDKLKYVLISIGKDKKSDAAKKISIFLEVSLDEVMRQLPNGFFKTELKIGD
ncbi:MAG: NFACT RNA binding domain-containing protein [Candidatus Micrarchaeia archaeon]